ncbi:MAG: hypothetical protein JXN60_02275, partial [Lentisphaerae bacterium]|nr:hypothetical protein [Lentisphaerota bacterium]
RLSEESVPKKYAIKSPQDVYLILKSRACNVQREVFWVLLLDAKNRLQNHPIEVTSGLLDASLVHPREVFREAIRSAAAAVVLAHNHPSGDCEPSAEDIRITRQLVQAGHVVDIRVLDHVVIGNSNDSASFKSMRESGCVAFA